jgi:hypothetical protein
VRKNSGTTKIRAYLSTLTNNRNKNVTPIVRRAGNLSFISYSSFLFFQFIHMEHKRCVFHARLDLKRTN